MSACTEADPELFASPLRGHHTVAKQFCDRCPAAAFAACARIRDDLLADGEYVEGTWAGVLLRPRVYKGTTA